MANYKLKEVKISDLVVNPDNYRFDAVRDEPSALKKMMDSLGKEVSNLARDIVTNGLNPLRTPLVIFNGQKYVVYDGNRRTTALKLLDDPELIKEKYPFKQVFISLKESGYTPPSKVTVVVYDQDDAEIADRWVYIEHNGQNHGVGTVAWGAKEKARFAAKNNGSVADKALQLTDLLDSMKINTSKLDQSTLNRLLSDPVVRNRMGVEFVKGTLSIDDRATALPRIQKVIEKMQKPGFKVGDVYLKDDRTKWIDETLPEKTTTPQPKTTPPKAGKKPTKKTFLGLIDPSEEPEEKLPEKIKGIHNELIHISVNKTPHATAALLRIYMELLSKEYLVKYLGYQQQGEKLVDSSGGGDFTELKAKLGAIKTDASTPKEIKGALQVLMGKDIITTRFNQVMHNIIFTETEHELRSIWVNLREVMYHIGKEVHKKS
jgi:hypothetical protein